MLLIGFSINDHVISNSYYTWHAEKNHKFPLENVMIWTSTFKQTLLRLHLNFASMFGQAFEWTF